MIVRRRAFLKLSRRWSRAWSAALTVALLPVLVPASVMAQTPGEVPAAFRRAMMAVGEAFTLVETLVDSPAFLLNSARGEALTRVGEIRRHLTPVEAEFARRGWRDGVRRGRDLHEALDAMEHELRVAEPDQAAALEVLGTLRDGCATCHKVYRAGDAVTGFRFSPGLP